MPEVYRRIRQANKRQALDRGQWADETQLLIANDFSGAGSQLIDVEFGIVFDGAPLYSWGVELQEDEILTPGDYPHVTSGVSSWVTKQASTNEQSNLLYLGASIWFRTVSSRDYRTRLRMSFEGVAFKNPQYFVGA